LAPEISINPWLIACRSGELGSNRPFGAIADNVPLVLFRDRWRLPRALEDRCAHRNAPLSRGRVRDGRLQCGYHGWTYDSDGLLVEVPALADGAAPTERCSVRRYHAAEQDGFVWVSLGERSPDVPPPRFPHLDEPGWTSFTMKTLFEAPIEACLENFLDCPHATYLHRYWFRAPTARRVRAVVRTLTDGAEAEFHDEPREKSLVWWLLAPRGEEMRHTDRFVAPRTSSVTYEFSGGICYTITSSCTALAENRTQVYTVISFRYGRIGPLVRLVFQPLARRIIRQDVEMLAAQQRNVERFGGARFANTRADLLGRHIVAWRRGLQRGEPTPAAGQRTDVDIRL
jgi:phenylpropionate dioxygenase-like ring-hydroxylating dioxygenase large terminal subunit